MRNKILPLIPPHNFYVEPFCGGASVFFLKGGEGDAHLNDLDAELLNCFVHIRNYPEALIKRLMMLSVCLDTYRFIRDEFLPADDLDRAARYYFLNHTSYAGITHRRVCYWSARSPLTATHSGWEKRIHRASQRLQSVYLTNQDFEDVIDNAPDGAFLYVDPPYRSTRHYRYYAHCFDWEDHQRLATCLRRHCARLRWLVTYDDCTQIRDLYAWAPRIGMVDRPNRIDRLDNKSVSGHVPAQHSVGRELLIRNYAGLSHKWAIRPPREGGAVSNFVALTDDQWFAIQPLLQPLPRRVDKRGRPWRDSRDVLDGILWVLTRGATWNTLPPARYPPYQTCHRRYVRWLVDGTLFAVTSALQDVRGPVLPHVSALLTDAADDARD